MSAINLDVNNMITEINRIYSASYKKFFKIKADRYINVEDLIVDLSMRISMWDSHASLTYRSTLQDNTAYRINSYGNAYVYVSKNAKIDNIHTIFKSLVDKGIKTITINILSLNITQKNEDLAYHTILPFVNVDIDLIDSDTKKSKNLFSFDSKTRVYRTLAIKGMVESTVKLLFEGIKINILARRIWYKRLHHILFNCPNVTIYTYVIRPVFYYYKESELFICHPVSGEKISMVVYGYPKSIIISKYPKKIKLKTKELPKKYRPMA